MKHLIPNGLSQHSCVHVCAARLRPNITPALFPHFPTPPHFTPAVLSAACEPLPAASAAQRASAPPACRPQGSHSPSGAACRSLQTQRSIAPMPSGGLQNPFEGRRRRPVHKNARMGVGVQLVCLDQKNIWLHIGHRPNAIRRSSKPLTGGWSACRRCISPSHFNQPKTLTPHPPHPTCRTRSLQV